MRLMVRLIVLVGMVTATGGLTPTEGTQRRNELERIVRIGKNNLLVVPAQIGKFGPVPFVLDSGASSVILNRRLLLQSQLSPGEARAVGGGGSNSCTEQLLPGAKVHAAGVALEKPAYVAPLEHLESFVGVDINGIAGGELFLKHQVQIDLSKHSVDVLQANNFDLNMSDTVIPLQSLRGTCCIVEAEVRIGDKNARGRFIVDTGAPGFELVLGSLFARQHGMRAPATASTIKVPTFCAASSVAPVTEHGRVSLESENKEVRANAADVVVFASSDAEGTFAQRDIDGIIGSELLRKMGPVVIFDAPHHRLILRATHRGHAGPINAPGH
jgi:hypothetical protein